MVTYLDILNRARARQAQVPLTSTSVGSTNADSLIGLQAVNEAVNELYENSFDIDQSDRITDVVTVSGQSLLPAPTGTNNWDSNVIKAVKTQDSGATSLRPLVLITPEDAEDYKLKTFSSNQPQYYWIFNSDVYVLPVPQQLYTLKAFHQAIVPDVTSVNINDTIVLPTSGIEALVSLTYAHLRNGASDPQWQVYEQKGKDKLKRFLTQRNKHGYKSKGFRVIRMNYNYADRNL